MKRFSQGLLLVFLVIISLSLPVLIKRLTHSVHIERLHTTIPYRESWDLSSQLPLNQVKNILSQNFYYLGRGSQSFVFISEDRASVLKFFIFDSTDLFSHRFFNCLLRRDRDCLLDQKSQMRAFQVLEASKLACQYLAEETGIIYVHLNLTEDDLTTVHLKGPFWKRLNIPLHSFRFVLQKRADSFDDSLMQAYLQHDRERFNVLIDRFNQLLDRRIAYGIVNTDPTLFENFGVIGNQPIEIDFGNFVYRPMVCSKNHAINEKVRYTSQLMKWVERYTPEWTDDVVLIDHIRNQDQK